jgi:hypothetical protein
MVEAHEEEARQESRDEERRALQPQRQETRTDEQRSGCGDRPVDLPGAGERQAQERHQEHVVEEERGAGKRSDGGAARNGELGDAEAEHDAEQYGGAQLPARVDLQASKAV